MAFGRPISLTSNVGSKIIRVLATEGQTSFTVNGGYRVNQIGVFRNGVRLSNNSDFTALDGVTVTLVNAASLDDEVLFEIQDDFRVADAIVSAASTQTIYGDIAIDGDFYYTGSSTGIVTTITAGDNISVNQSTGSVVITGLANTANVVADTLKVTGITTLGIVVGGGGTFTEPVSFNEDVIAKGGASGSGAITLNCETNTHGVKLKGPAHSAGASYTLVLPPNTGSANQVLTTDGNGSMSWQDTNLSLSSLPTLP